ncbi:MAG: hypothetical protein ACR650_09435 [Methylocystis sp.]|jgi:hypothetical protein
MTRTSSFLRSGAASRSARALLLIAALLTGAPFVALLAVGPRAGAGGIASSLFVCFASGSPSPDAQTGRPSAAGDHRIDCVLCQTLCSGAAPLAARPGVVVAAHIQRLNLPWMVADRAAPTTRTRLPHWARAPPVPG